MQSNSNGIACLGLLLSAFLTAATPAQAHLLFGEGFDTSAANVKVNRSADSAIDYVDYSYFTVGSSAFSVPEAPNPVAGSAASRGVLLRVNHSGTPGGTGAPAAINLLAGATPLSFSGNYSVSYDVYMSISNPSGIGSTQQALFGLGTNDDATLEASFNRGVAGPDPVGTWGWLTGDNGTTTEDAALNQGDVELADIGDTNAADGVAGVSPRLFNLAFAHRAATLNSAPANQWVHVELRTYAGQISVLFNGVRFFGSGQQPILSAATSGYALLGYEDKFASISQSPDLEWALFDNFVVEQIPPVPDTIFEWEYRDAGHPGLGKQPSVMPTAGGIGLHAAPGMNATGKNLDHAYLVGADLSNSILDATNLTRAALDDVNLTNASLVLTNLTGATLKRANLAGAWIKSANLSSSDITLTQLYSTASYTAHDLTGIQFIGADFSGATLIDQNLSATNFYAAKLGGANLARTNLTNAEFVSADLSGADLSSASVAYATFALANLSGADLTNANFSGANFIGTSFAGADIRGANLSPSQQLVAQDPLAGYYCGPKHNGLPCNFSKPLFYWGIPTQVIQTVGTGIILAQLVSTASYAAHDLSGVTLANSYFNGANFAGFNLTNANFAGTVLDGVDFSGADARGAIGLEGIAASNFIRSDGQIQGLTLDAGETLAIRNYEAPTGAAAIPIHVDQQFSVTAGATLQVFLDADSWNSEISFAAGIPVLRGGLLELAFAPGVDFVSQVGHTFDLFDWTGVTPTGTFAFASAYSWDLTKLYTTGEVTLLSVGAGSRGLPAVPEPSSILLESMGLLACLSTRRRRSASSIALFALVFSVIGIGSVHAATPTVPLSKVGNPTWRPVDFQLFSAPATPFNQTFGNVYNHLLPYDTPLATTYVPHAGPYDTELSTNAAAAGYVSHTLFPPEAITLNPNGLYIGFMLVPDPGITGSSRDFASGPVIPNSVFPIASNGDVWLNGVLVDRLLGADFFQDVGLRDVGKDGTSHLEFLQAIWHPWDDDLTVGPLGRYDFQLSIRDNGGAGWDGHLRFRVAIPGDFDYSGSVGPEDYGVWKSNFGSTTNLDADGNDDHVVDAADYTIWRDRYSQPLGPGGGAALPSAALLSPAVPEPATFLLAAAALGVCAARHRCANPAA